MKGMVVVDQDNDGFIKTVEVLYRPDVEEELSAAMERLRELNKQAKE